MASLLCILQSCAGPRPETPITATVAPPGGWRSVNASNTMVDADWWSAFGDPVLTRLVETALAGNTDIAIAVARVDEARAQLNQARADLLPRLDGSAGVLRQRDVGALGTARIQTAAQPALAASYEVDLFGRIRNANAAARAGLQASADARDAIRLSVAATTASAYITLRSLDARLRIARATLADRASALRFATRRADTGYSSALEMRQAEAEYRATEQLIPQAQLAITRQENAISILIGTAPGDVVRGRDIADLLAPTVPPGLPSALLRRRPDIAQAEQLVVAADRTLDAARAAFLPSVRLTGTVGAAFSTLLADPITLWSLGGSILAPIFEGGRLRAQSDAAAARRDQAAFAYRRTALQAFREVEDGLAATTRSSEQLAALRQQRAALSAGLRLATNRYDAGYSPYLDQLDAQRGLLTAELSVVQAEADRLLAAVALYQAVGGGWTEMVSGSRDGGG